MAWAVDRHVELTGDRGALVDGGIEVLVETVESLDAVERAIAEQKRAERLKKSAAATRAARR